MVFQVTTIGITEYELQLSKLTSSLQSALTEARLLRRTVEMVDEIRRSVAYQLARPHRPRHLLDLKHANRVF